MLSQTIMKENQLSTFTRTAIWLFVVAAGVLATTNAVNGTVTRPRAFLAVLAGFILFACAKLSVISKGQALSFGPKRMSSGMANLYRVGYWLMVVGFLATFVP